MPGPIQRGRAFVERILNDGVETVNTDEQHTSEGLLWGRGKNEDIYQVVGPASVVEDPATTTSDSYTTIANMGGGYIGGPTPDGVSLYARHLIFGQSNDDTATASFAPRIWGDSGSTTLTELEVEVTSAGSTSEITDWVEITASDGLVDGPITALDYRAKVESGGEAEISGQRVAIIFAWGLD